MTTQRERLQVLAYFFLQYRRRYLSISAMSIVAGLLEGVNIGMLLPILQSIVSGNTISFPGSERLLGLMQQYSINADPFVVFCLGLLFVTLLRNALEVATGYAIVASSAKVMRDIRQQVYQTYASATSDFLVENKGGELAYNSHIPAKSLAKVLSTAPQLVVELFRAVSLIAVLIWANAEMALVLLAVSGLLYFLMTRFMGRKLYSVGLVSRDANTKLSGLLNEFFNGFRQILIGNAKSVWLGELDSVNETLRQAYIREVYWPQVPSNAIEVLTITAIFGLIIILKLVSSPADFQSNISFLGVFALALMRLLPSYITLSRIPVDITNALPEVERLYGIVHQAVPRARNGTKPVPPLTHGVVFDSVTFSYANRPPLFTDLSLEFPYGQFSAVVGPSGGGKTTLMNLILGLYIPSSGKILVDGLDLSEIDLTTWYRRVGFVSQQVFIFNASALDNIRMFNKRYSQEQVEEAAKVSMVHEFIMELPQGYDTIVGERGMRLSGGQQQRLAIARAVLYNPDLLLLDEATSALDTVSERFVQQAIYSAAKGRTVIAIAHRISTIINADRIFVIENGRVVEQGTHSDLITQDGVYASLAKMQAGNGKESDERS